MQIVRYSCLFYCLLFTVFVYFFEFQNNIPIRGDPHVLIVGDPGLGKSQVGRSILDMS